MKKGIYPSHLYNPIRIELAVSYLQHEFRKLLWRVPENHWPAIDQDIAAWMKSPQLNTPRDFWNGFHGIAMGFKLKIGLIYFVTAENIQWRKEAIPVEKLTFGIEFPPTQRVKKGILAAKIVSRFYQDLKNKSVKEEQKQITEQFSQGTPSRDEDPIIVTEKMVDEKEVLSVYEGNRRLFKAILDEKKRLSAIVGRFTTKEKKLRNYWIPTSVLMEILYFAREAFERKDGEGFKNYMAVLRDLLAKSESAVYELKNRALTNKQPFRSEVLKFLNLA